MRSFSANASPTPPTASSPTPESGGGRGAGGVTSSGVGEASSTASSSQKKAGAASGPSPLTVGKRFVKHYYEVLSTTPDQIFRFYQPSSCLSHGEGSKPTTPSPFERYDVSGRWGRSSKKRIELEHGSIDAQPSVNGGILLVVTGHVVFLQTDSDDEERKAFVHTIFLATLANAERFYVHNDILRFLQEAEQEEEEELSSQPEKQQQQEPAKTADVGVTIVPTEPSPNDKAASTNEEEDSQQKEQKLQSQQQQQSATEKSEPVQEQGDDAATGGVVDETKDGMIGEASEVPTPEFVLPKRHRTHFFNRIEGKTIRLRGEHILEQGVYPAQKCLLCARKTTCRCRRCKIHLCRFIKPGTEKSCWEKHHKDAVLFYVPAPGTVTKQKRERYDDEDKSPRAKRVRTWNSRRSRRKTTKNKKP